MTATRVWLTFSQIHKKPRVHVYFNGKRIINTCQIPEAAAYLHGKMDEAFTNQSSQAAHIHIRSSADFRWLLSYVYVRIGCVLVSGTELAWIRTLRLLIIVCSLATLIQGLACSSFVSALSSASSFDYCIVLILV